MEGDLFPHGHHAVPWASVWTARPACVQLLWPHPPGQAACGHSMLKGVYLGCRAASFPHPPPALLVSLRSLSCRAPSWPLPCWATCQRRLQGRGELWPACTTCSGQPSAGVSSRGALLPEALPGVLPASRAQLSPGGCFRAVSAWAATVGSRSTQSSLPLAWPQRPLPDMALAPEPSGDRHTHTQGAASCCPQPCL